jgi:hypothetical protein
LRQNRFRPSVLRVPFYAFYGLKVMMFLLHQVISTAGVIVISGVITFAVMPLLNAIGVSVSRASWLLTEIPGFPLQSVAGILVGYLAERIAGSKSALWVWIVPGLFFCFGAFAIAPSKPSIVVHLLGSGCKPAEHCFDQLLFTLPFIASLGYTTGALLARVGSMRGCLGHTKHD